MKSKPYRLLLPGLRVDALQDAPSVDAMLLTVAYQRLPLATLLACVAVGVFGPLYYFFLFHNGWMLAWIGAVAANYSCSAIACWFFFRQRLSEDSLPRWSRILLVLSFFNGLAWSFGPLTQLHTPLNGGEVAVLVVSLICVSSVTMALLLGQRWGLIVHMTAALVPTIILLLLAGGALANTLALLMVTAGISFTAVGLDFNHSLRSFFKTQIRLTQAAKEASLAREHAERSTAMKSQFVASVSHDIRTPMHAILGMLKLLQSADLNARQADYAGKVEATAKSLLGLLNDILDFSKIEAEQMDLSLHPFRLDRMLQDLAVVLSANAHSKPVEVLYDIDTGIPKVLLGDAMRLRQVLLNITGNALKFTAQGEVVLRIQLLRQNAQDCTLHFSVRDTGIGMSPESLQQIFAGDGQTDAGNRQFSGAGLGLPIARRLVAMMGGQLQAQSMPGAGSLFFFELTLQALQSTPEVGHVAKTANAANSVLNALVVDGGATARDLATNMCRSWGWTVEAVDSGELAIELARTRRHLGAPEFDVVILEWVLPGRDGWQTMEALHAMQMVEGVTSFILVSGYGRERLLERSQAELDLMSSYLPKPFTASMLFDAVALARSPVNATVRPMAVSAPRVARLKGVKVLVVEDNLMNQQVVKELLEIEGAQVHVVSNGQQAVDALRLKEMVFDAVLMDLQMPNMDGYAATRIIRKELGLHNLPVIAITANMMPDDKKASLSAGMNAHIGKPFNIDLLVRVIQKEHAVTRS